MREAREEDELPFWCLKGIYFCVILEGFPLLPVCPGSAPPCLLPILSGFIVAYRLLSFLSSGRA
jgi:hypothetical protein